ncbi:MAG: hypothetical protein PVG76_09675, partial [Chromatiales bacterium]
VFVGAVQSDTRDVVVKRDVEPVFHVLSPCLVGAVRAPSALPRAAILGRPSLEVNPWPCNSG